MQRQIPYFLRLLALVPCLCMLVTACGGGGGGNGGSSSTTSSTYTLSGTIELPETAAVDSDTNDAGQAGRTSNDTFPTAQSLVTPVQLVGTVNMPHAGPSGASTGGDVNDYFKATLTQGQVIEMAYVGNGSADDVDMYLVDDASGSLVASATSAATAKCIQVGRSAAYYLRIQAAAGSALYTVRIGAPGDATCSVVSTSTDSIIAGELVAKPAFGSTSTTRRQVLQAASVQTLDGESRERPHLLRLSQDEPERIAGLARLAHRRSQDVRQSADTEARERRRMPARFRRALRSMETLEYAKRLMATGMYEYVEPNFRVEMLAYSPTDPLYAAQRWNYQQINQPAAMDRVAGLGLPPSTQRPIVAVIDSGIAGNHSDLVAQIYTGYSFVSSDDSAPGDGDMANGDDPSVGADTPVWHGTHVAGTIAAIDNNGQFGAGVAPQALLMPLRVFAPGKNASSYDIVQAIRYAARLSNRSGTLPARKADVINMSIGSAGPCAAQFSSEIANARAQGVVVVAAAGNHSRGSTADVTSPANCPGVIAVGALDALKRPAFYSNAGATLRISAPGGDAYQSTTGTGYSDAVYSTLASFDGTGTRMPSFGPLMGTSMAAPHVSGVIALMRYVHPAITPAEIDTLIANGQITDDIGATGRDDATGYGLINARKAVDQALALASSGGTVSGIVIASPASISFGSLSASTTLELKLTAPGTETITSVMSSSPAVTVTASSVSPGTGLGTYTISVDRALLPLGSSFPVLMVTTSTRSFTVQLTIIKAPPGSSSAASYGRMIVYIADAASGSPLGQVNVNVSGGKYAWSMSGIPARQVRIVAGTNLNYNGYFCDTGEVCGIYPNTADSIAVNGNMSGLDFSVAPTTSTWTSTLSTLLHFDPGTTPGLNDPAR